MNELLYSGQFFHSPPGHDHDDKLRVSHGKWRLLSSSQRYCFFVHFHVYRKRGQELPINVKMDKEAIALRRAEQTPLSVTYPKLIVVVMARWAVEKLTTVK